MHPEVRTSRNRWRLLIALGAALVVLVYIRGIPQACVVLPSGINLGKEAMLNLGNPLGRPRIVAKLGNGHPLTGGDAWPFYATATTVHGLALEADHQDDYWFAWREDTGLVLKAKNAESYARILAEAGEPLDGIREGAVGPSIVFRDLSRSPAYAGNTCRTRWITW